MPQGKWWNHCTPGGWCCWSLEPKHFIKRQRFSSRDGSGALWDSHFCEFRARESGLHRLLRPPYGIECSAKAGTTQPLELKVVTRPEEQEKKEVLTSQLAYFPSVSTAEEVSCAVCLKVPRTSDMLLPQAPHPRWLALRTIMAVPANGSWKAFVFPERQSDSHTLRLGLLLSQLFPLSWLFSFRIYILYFLGSIELPLCGLHCMFIGDSLGRWPGLYWNPSTLEAEASLGHIKNREILFSKDNTHVHVYARPHIGLTIIQLCWDTSKVPSSPRFLKVSCAVSDLLKSHTYFPNN